jgi:hypothetical protein
VGIQNNQTLTGWRKIVSSRTTGIVPESIRSRNTFPAPTDGMLVHIPHQQQRLVGESAFNN